MRFHQVQTYRERICVRGYGVKIEYVLTDVDGTLTSVDKTGGMGRSILSHFQEAAGCDDVPPSDVCISKTLEKYGISPEDFARKLREDLARHTVLRPDAVEFLRFCKSSGRRLYTATTNSKYIALLKLSLGGITEKDFSGFFGGDAFGDPLGKGSPAYFPSILAALGSTGENVAMIGDEPDFDLYPALRAGVGTVIIVDLRQREDVCRKNGAYFVNSLIHAEKIIGDKES